MTPKLKTFLPVPVIILLISVLLLAGFVAGDFKKSSQVSVDGTMLACDPLGNVYVTNEYELKKLDPQGEELFTYSNFIAGNITHVDPSDPFKVLVYFKEFGQVDVLDNTLSPTTDPLLLQSYGYELATLVCRSYNNGMWIYDPLNFELLRFNQSMQISDRTGNINQLTGLEIDPNYLLESDNNLYLNDPSAGLLVFDRYGTYYKTYPFKDIKSFQVQNEKIIYFTGEKLVIHDTRKLVSSEVKTGISGVVDAKVSLDLDPQQVYLLDGAKLHILQKQN